MLRKLLFAATALVAASPAAAQNIVNNPGFENGSASWYGNFGFLPGSAAHTGNGFANSACGGAGCTSTYGSGSYLGQSLSTVAGQAYDFSFWVAELGGPTSEFSVFWNGRLVSDVVNPNNNSFSSGNYNYRQFFVNGLVATGATTDLQIHGRQDPGLMLIDDVSITAATAAVPEPATWAMMIAGFGGIGGALRRRRQTSVCFA